MLPLDNEIVVLSSTSSGSETDTDNDELNDNTQPLPEDQPDKLDNYHGFKMDYPAVHKRNRSRKIRTCARVKGVPPSGRKKSQQKSYNKPARVSTLLKIYSKTRKEKVKVKGPDGKPTTVEMLCTPEPFINSAGMLFSTCCLEVQSVHRGSCLQTLCG